MAKPLPLPVWDRRSGKSFNEWMDDHTPTYESEPRRSVTQWIKSQPLYDRLYAAYRDTRWSAREIEPFINKYHIDMSEFEPLQYRSFAEFFDRRFGLALVSFPRLRNRWEPLRKHATSPGIHWRLTSNFRSKDIR
jgi:phosphatidylserine decarboxylase